MNIEIKRWDNNKIIVCGEYESIKNCIEKNRDTSFYRADLRSADLSSADLRSADLSYADLSYANLRYANLRSADLSSAKNINKFLTTPLYGMLDNDINRAYKIVNKDNVGIYNGGLVYKVGEIIEEKDANTNEKEHCGSGINLATLDWCVNIWEKGMKILICEFKKEDIACIPVGSDGKFRVFRCKVIGEKNLKEIGLI